MAQRHSAVVQATYTTSTGLYINSIVNINWSSYSLIKKVKASGTCFLHLHLMQITYMSLSRTLSNLCHTLQVIKSEKKDNYNATYPAAIGHIAVGYFHAESFLLNTNSYDENHVSIKECFKTIAWRRH